MPAALALVPPRASDSRRSDDAAGRDHPDRGSLGDPAYGRRGGDADLPTVMEAVRGLRTLFKGFAAIVAFCAAAGGVLAYLGYSRYNAKADVAELRTVVLANRRASDTRFQRLERVVWAGALRECLRTKVGATIDAVRVCQSELERVASYADTVP